MRVDRSHRCEENEQFLQNFWTKTNLP